jgi:succinate-semialdehyde dehydrogenase / glutarate-semialdehyde dehydrogenase
MSPPPKRKASACYGIKGLIDGTQVGALANPRRVTAMAEFTFTRSLRNTRLLTRGVEVGMLWINQTAATWPELPFSGVKDSGYGSEGGPEAMDAYLNSRTVSVLQV